MLTSVWKSALASQIEARSTQEQDWIERHMHSHNYRCFCVMKQSMMSLSEGSTLRQKVKISKHVQDC